MPSAIIVDVDLLDLFPSSEPFGLRLVSNYMAHPQKTASQDDFYNAKSLIEHDPNKLMTNQSCWVLV
jgi:hypothetical protein